MADSLRYKDWYDKAEKDLQGAKILFQYEADYGLVAFHCQQAMEKGLKGFILQHLIELTEGHSLVYLCKRASGIDEEIKRYLKDCAYVNQFYIETRYPADIIVKLDKNEAEECIEMTERLLKRIIEGV